MEQANQAEMAQRVGIDRSFLADVERARSVGFGCARFVDASAASLVPFVQDSVEPGSIIHTDRWLGYLPVESKGYQHEVTFLKGKKKTSIGADATGSPRDLSAQTVADGNPSGSSQS